MKISIIIPTLGRDVLPAVTQGISSCDGFSDHEVEILIVFDTTGPLPIFRQTSEFKVLRNTGKKGCAGARNVGIDNATGDIIAFLGDDTVPRRNWLTELVRFHTEHPEPHMALLGNIAWPEELESDPFHKWIEGHFQFDFVRLRKGKTPNWRHFYTANLSLKREFIGTERFFEDFQGWGFEDTEFGYRLSQKGMKLIFEPKVEVLHAHYHDLEHMKQKLTQAGPNALLFEALHPELNIAPTADKKLFLWIALGLAWPISLVREKTKWWRECKIAWMKGV